jgi:hypothetical protein
MGSRPLSAHRSSWLDAARKCGTATRGEYARVDERAGRPRSSVMVIDGRTGEEKLLERPAPRAKHSIGEPHLAADPAARSRGWKGGSLRG